MSQMVFRPGTQKVWKGVAYDWKIIKEDELQDYLDSDWVSHPDDLLKTQEDEPKRGRKPKAVADEPDDEE